MYTAISYLSLGGSTDRLLLQAFVNVFGDYAGWAHNALFISQLASHKHLLEKVEADTKGVVSLSKGSSASDASIEVKAAGIGRTKSPPQTPSSKAVRARKGRKKIGAECSLDEVTVKSEEDGVVQVFGGVVAAASGDGAASKRGRKRKNTVVHDA